MSERDTAARGIPFAGDSLVHMLEHRAAAQPDETAYTFLRDGELPSADDRDPWQHVKRLVDELERAVSDKLS